jgi:predicted GNAT family acetyltransferase
MCPASTRLHRKQETGSLRSLRSSNNSGTGTVLLLIMYTYTGCSFCRLIRRPELLIGRHTVISRQTEGHSFGDHMISESVNVTSSSVFYCAMFCVFMTRVRQCLISLRTEYPLVTELHKVKQSCRSANII